MRYRHHSLEFKCELVERSFMPGASVAKLAREHGLNANQLFTWRSAWRAGKLDSKSSNAFLAVTIRDTSANASVSVAPTISTPAATQRVAPARIVLEHQGAQLSIEGTPDHEVLAQVLSALLR